MATTGNTNDFDVPDDQEVEPSTLETLEKIDDHLGAIYVGAVSNKRLSYGIIRTLARSDYSLRVPSRHAVPTIPEEEHMRPEIDHERLRVPKITVRESPQSLSSLFRFHPRERMRSSGSAKMKLTVPEEKIEEMVSSIVGKEEDERGVDQGPALSLLKCKLPKFKRLIKPETQVELEQQLLHGVSKQYLKKSLDNPKAKVYTGPPKKQHRYHAPKPLPTGLKDMLNKRVNQLMFERNLASEKKLDEEQRIKKRRRQLASVKKAERRRSLTQHFHQRFTVQDQEGSLERFRRCGQLIITFWRICDAFQNMAIEAGLMNAGAPTSQGLRFGTGAESGGQEIMWDMTKYRRNKMNSMEREIIYALQKRSEHRSHHEVKVITHCLSKFTALKKYSQDLLYKFCQVATYCSVGKKRTVVRKGHISWTIYLIYSGTVSVVQEDDAESQLIKQDAIILRKGAVFGEVGVLHETARTATITTVDDCEFILVDKDDFFRQGLHHCLKDMDEKKFKFYRSQPFFRYISDEKLESLARLSRIETFRYKEIVLRDSSVNHWLWFILEGSCDVLRFVPLETLADYNFFRELPCNKRLLSEQEVKVARIKSLRQSLTNSQIVSSVDMREKQLEEEEDRRQLFNAGVMEEADTSQLMKAKSLPMVDKRKGVKSEPNVNTNAITDDDWSSILDQQFNGDPSKRKRSYRETEYMVNTEGVYMLIDTRTRGSCYGLDFLFDDKEARRYSHTLVSDNCSIMQVPVQTFRDHVNADVLLQLQIDVTMYPRNEVLMSTFVNHNIWSMFKRMVVEDKVVDVLLALPYEKHLRGQAARTFSVERKVHDVTDKYPRDKRFQRQIPVGRSYGAQGILDDGSPAVERYGVAARSHIPAYGFQFNPDTWTRAEENKLLIQLPQIVDDPKSLRGRKTKKGKPPPSVTRKTFVKQPTRKLSDTDKVSKEVIVGECRLKATDCPRKVLEAKPMEIKLTTPLPMISLDKPDFTKTPEFQQYLARMNKHHKKATPGIQFTVHDANLDGSLTGSDGKGQKGSKRISKVRLSRSQSKRQSRFPPLVTPDNDYEFGDAEEEEEEEGE